MIWHKRQVRATPDELRHIELIRSLPCCVCPEDFVCGPTEANHILLNGRRISHFHIIPLGIPHHRTGPLNVTQHRKKFETKFGTQRSLWEKLHVRLGITGHSWPESKLVARRA